MKLHRLPLLALFTLLLPAVGCDVPIGAITEGDAYRTPPPATYISGRIVIQDGISSAPRGPAIVFRFACDNPGPPLGAGSPVDMVVVAESAFSGGEAEFTFPEVPAGACVIITGYVDRDRDFDLLLSIGAQPTAGDLAFVTRIVQIEGASGSGWVPPVENLEIRAATIVPLDKPAFRTIFRNAPGPEELPEGILFDFVIGSVGTQFIEVHAEEITSSIQDVEGTEFTMIFAPDLDGDGSPDDVTGTGFADFLFPTVVFRKLDDSDPTGLTLDTENPIIIPASPLPFDPTNIFSPEFNMLLRSGELDLPFDGVAQFTSDRFLAAMRELVLIDRATRTTQAIDEFEAETGRDVTGIYQMMVMNSSGQLWTIPNETAAAGYPAQGLRMRVTRPAPE